MKKMVAMLSSIAVFAMGGIAYAATSAGTLYTSSAGGDVQANETGGAAKSIAKMSTNVTLKVFWSTTAFAAGTYHKSGNREYATNNAETKIYYKEIGAGKTQTDLTDSGNATFSSWASL